MRYLYDNIPHHQDQVKSPRKLRNGTPWSEILSLLNNLLRNDQEQLPPIVKDSLEGVELNEDSLRRKGKR